MSKYDATDSYTYPETNILRNKADIRDQAALDAFEADATAVRLIEILDNPTQGQFDLPHLQAIHRHLFQDVYEWAGEFRTVDLSKGTSRFANQNMISSYLGPCLKSIRTENLLSHQPPAKFIERLAHYMGEINATHPFREGNGRAQRAFISQLADSADYFIDFTNVTQEEMYFAMTASFNGNQKPLIALLTRITSELV